MGGVGKLPQARVVRTALDLAPPPRRIPFALWVGVWIGGSTRQTIIWTLALLAVTFAAIFHKMDEMNRVGALVVLPGGLVVLSPVFIIQARKTLRTVRVVRHGVATRGTLIEKTTRRGHKTTIYSYRFAYETTDGSKKETMIEREDFEAKALEDEPTEALLYDPLDRDPATTLDNLPGSPAVGEDGQLALRSKAYLWMLLGPLLLAGALVSMGLRS